MLNSTNKVDISKQFESKESEILYFQSCEFYNYVEEDDRYMQMAKNAAVKHSLTPTFPIGIVIVNNGEVISESANGNGYHEKNLESPGHKGGCVRRFVSEQREHNGLEKLKSGEGFELCEGCDTESHAEARAIKESIENQKISGADLYMYGHFWCCKDCFIKMKNAGIGHIFVVREFGSQDKKKIKEWQKEFLTLKNAKI